MHANRPTNHPSNNYGVMVIFQFFKMAAGRHLGFSNSVNLNDQRVVDGPDPSPCQISSSSGCEDIAISPVFFKLAAVRHLGYVFYVTGPATNLQCIFGGLYCHAKFGWNLRFIGFRRYSQVLGGCWGWREICKNVTPISGKNLSSLHDDASRTPHCPQLVGR